MNKILSLKKYPWERINRKLSHKFFASIMLKRNAYLYIKRIAMKDANLTFED